MAARVDVTLTVGDRFVSIRGRFQTRDNPGDPWQPIDLSDSTISFRMVDESQIPPVVKVNWAAAQIEDAVEGLVYYPPLAVDVNTAGLYRAYFRATTAGLPLTLPPEGFLVELKAVP